MAGKIDVIDTELTTDPGGRGYSGMDDQAAADDMNLERITRVKAAMNRSELLEAIDDTEWQAVTAAERADIWGICAVDEVNPQGFERDVFVDVFGIGSVTIASLATLRQETISRATELEIATVASGEVGEARR